MTLHADTFLTNNIGLERLLRFAGIEYLTIPLLLLLTLTYIQLARKSSLPQAFQYAVPLLFTLLCLTTYYYSFLLIYFIPTGTARESSVHPDTETPSTPHTSMQQNNTSYPPHQLIAIIILFAIMLIMHATQSHITTTHDRYAFASLLLAGFCAITLLQGHFNLHSKNQSSDPPLQPQTHAQGTSWQKQPAHPSSYSCPT
jgi:hypothetical protein